MDFGAATYALSFAAGLLSTLSPCVLPLIPLVLAGASNAHRRGPLALGLGLALSFTLIGTLLAASGTLLGLHPSALRTLGAVLLGAFGLVLLSSRLQARFAMAVGPLSSAGGQWLANVQPGGLGSQFLIGLVLGLVWSPCVGPTLGGAVALASQGGHIVGIATVMAMFGLGAGAPLILLGQLSNQAFRRWRGQLSQAGSFGKSALGGLLLLVSIGILTRWDHPIEAWLIDHSPDWLTALTTRF